MDLLRLILVHLPLKRVPQTLVDRQFIELRLKVINQMPETAARDFQSYVELCTYQGEVCSQSYRYVPRRLLAARAGLLHDKAMFLLYRGTTDLDLILQSLPSPEESRDFNDRSSITAIASAGSIRNPDSICWTPGLRRYCTAQNPLLAGLSKTDRDGYYIEYFRSEMKRHSDPFASVEHLDTILETCLNQSIAKICAEAGYFPPKLFNIGLSDRELFSLAFRYVQPKLLRRLSPYWDFLIEYFQNINNSEIYPIWPFTPDKVERAREMIGVVKELYPNFTRYLTIIRVLTGQLIELGQLDSRDYGYVTDLMSDIAHPQLRLDMLRSGMMNFPGSIHYDLSVHFRNVVGFSVDLRLVLFYCQGNFMKIFSPEEIRIFTDQLKKLAEGS